MIYSSRTSAQIASKYGFQDLPQTASWLKTKGSNDKLISLNQYRQYHPGGISVITNLVRIIWRCLCQRIHLVSKLQYISAKLLNFGSQQLISIGNWMTSGLHLSGLLRTFMAITKKLQLFYENNDCHWSLKMYKE